MLVTVIHTVVPDDIREGEEKNPSPCGGSQDNTGLMETEKEKEKEKARAMNVKTEANFSKKMITTNCFGRIEIESLSLSPHPV